MLKGFFKFWKKKPKTALPQHEEVTVKVNVSEIDRRKTPLANDLSALTTAAMMSPEDLSIIEREKVRLINRRLGTMIPDNDLEERKITLRSKAIREKAEKQKSEVEQAKINAEIRMKNLEESVTTDVAKRAQKVLAQVAKTQETQIKKVNEIAGEFGNRVKLLEDEHKTNANSLVREVEAHDDMVIADAEKRFRKLITKLEALKKSQIETAAKLEADFLKEEDARFKKLFEMRENNCRKMEEQFLKDREPGLRAALKAYIGLWGGGTADAVMEYIKNPKLVDITPDPDAKMNVIRGLQKEITVNILKRLAALEAKEKK